MAKKSESQEASKPDLTLKDQIITQAEFEKLTQEEKDQFRRNNGTVSNQ